ncbi:MAG: lysophospholipase [Acidobacteriia bacterium]|nr:lysophospholipase [Terriglobia bacterium]
MDRERPGPSHEGGLPLLQSHDEYLTTPDGLRLFTRRCAYADPAAEIVLAHGFGEHSGRYTALVEHLSAHNIAVTVYDHRGHGKSEGLEGHVDRFSDYVDDLDLFISRVRVEDHPRRLFVIGHSMGGLIALGYAAAHGERVDGMVISAPLLGVAAPIPPLKLMTGRIAARLMPRLRLHNGLNPSHLSRSPEVALAYTSDPLVNFRVSARWFTEATKAMSEVMEAAPRILLPMLILQGGEDRIACPGTTRQFVRRLGSSDKEFGLYQGLYHELFNEPEKYEIYDRVSRWLEAH